MALSRSDAIHFLRRIGFTAPNDEIEAYRGLTRTEAVDKALDFTNSPALNPPAAIYNRGNQWDGFMALTDWWYDRMVTTPTPLEEKMALFWHDHFACSQEKVHDIEEMWKQQIIFRSHGLGDFETLLWNVSISGAMLVYIDNESNVKGAVQENFGRELMELHTVGVGEYNEVDVVAMSRAWTGHNTFGWNGTHHDNRYHFFSERHDYGNKRLFGLNRNWDARATITELVNGSKQTATARFIARKMWKWFAHANPSNALVNSLADTFISSGMNVTSLLRRILLHDNFWNSHSRNKLIRNPVEIAVAFYRTTGLPVSDANVWWHTLPMGMTLFEPPNVAGWGENEYWISTATSWGRAEFFGDYRWHLTEHYGFFADLDEETPANGVQRIFDTFEIWSPTNATRNHFLNWFTDAKNRFPWAIPTDAITLAPLCPDFQVV